MADLRVYVILKIKCIDASRKLFTFATDDESSVQSDLNFERKSYSRRRVY